MDYALKDTIYEELDDFGMKNYIFNTVVIGTNGLPLIPSKGLTETEFSPANLISH